MVMKERATPKPTHILIRGSYEHPGEEVERNTPAFLPPLKQKDGIYTRMDLAEWLVDPQAPADGARGRESILATIFWRRAGEDVGRFRAQGEWPSHPELLDALALSFIESGWDVKHLVRAIVLSNTYRQSSDATPEEYATTRRIACWPEVHAIAWMPK